MKIWSNFKILFNPGITALTLFIAGLNYFQLQNYTFNQSLLMGTGTALLGGLIGLILFQYIDV